jgi:formate dehydrogenase subunit gamma
VTAYDVDPQDDVRDGDPVIVHRYSGAARINHWITAASLVLLTISGLALFHPSLFFLTGLFGGGQNARAFHPWLGLLLFFSFTGLFIRFWRANLWKCEDTDWMLHLPDVAANREDRLPEVGRYNAGQKVVFWAMSVLIIVLILSGLVLWNRYFYEFTTPEQQRFAVLIHSAAAVTVICVWIVHVYAAIWLRGTFPAMIRGSVTGGWAWKHHRKWLRELVESRRVRKGETTPRKEPILDPDGQLDDQLPDSVLKASEKLG